MTLARELSLQRKNLVLSIEKFGHIKDPSIKSAMVKVRREDFVERAYFASAYVDLALPIPGGGSISQPTVHAMSLSALDLKKGEKFLEIGAGSGIMLAYAKEIVGKNGTVFGIEFNKETFEFGRRNLARAGFADKVTFIHGDGSGGLPDESPFDKVMISAACPKVPKTVMNQVRNGGSIVAVIGVPEKDQELTLLKKNGDGSWTKSEVGGVIFVPLRGKFGWKR